VIEEERKTAEADVAECVLDFYMLKTSIDNNTFTDKSWILDSDSAIHVCFQKEMLSFLVAKKEVTIKIVDGLACEIIDTETVNVTGRDGPVRALEVV